MPSCNGPADQWFDLTTTGLAALARDDRPAAAVLWKSAAGLACAEGLPAPFQAAAQNNAAIAELIDGRARDARHAFARARQHWVTAQEFASWTPLTAPIASSVFHLRLAMDHHRTFAQMKRDRSVRFCRVARAITALNRCNAIPTTPHRAHLELLTGALADTFGPRCGPLHILAEYAGDALLAAPAAAYEHQRLSALQLFQRQSAGAYDDIELAARLTVLVPPQFSCVALGRRGESPQMETN